MAKLKNWLTITESSFPWERDALEFVRDQFPDHEPYRAWSNFEFIADDGTVNEVDLLIFTPQGFFLIEIKSRPGLLRGDAGTWAWETEGKPFTLDNPYLLANSKAKKLRSLLQRQKACKGRGQVPFIEALVFCSAPDLRCELQGYARYHVCLRDVAAAGDQAARPGIIAAIKRRDCDGLIPNAMGTHDRPTGKMVAQAMEQSGIRPTQRSRKVSDYVLDSLVDDGPGYQDWLATHSTLKNIRRRVRIYNVRTGASQEERQTIERAARREAELLETLQHPGILRREGFTEHELGPALIFEHDPQFIRLDHFLTLRHAQLSLDQRLDLLRQIAEVVRFAHEKRVVHRALRPRSILVNPLPTGRFQIKLFNWQLGYREEGPTSSGGSRGISATYHFDQLVEETATAYMAPEAMLPDTGPGEHLDVFSLGALAYQIFSGQPPAADGLELSNKLRETRGLQISSVLNGASASLQDLVQWSTHADVGLRIDTVGDFLELLEKVEDEATSPDAENVILDPDVARKDDFLPNGFRVLRRLGKGSCAVVLLVEKDQQEYVLKIASSPEHNARVKEEDETLEKLRHNHIVAVRGTTEIGDRFAFLMNPVYSNKEERRIETLRDRLRHEGRLHIDLLQRFGEDLLDVLKFLEEESGIPHRDIKPDNIAIGQIKRGDKLHLVLFDFSLSKAQAENIRAGTTGYLDPFLPLRKHKRWDLDAERYAAAITLYELAAGPNTFPKWGDGASDPSHLSCEATIDGDLFDASLRDSLTDFFRKAFRRNPGERYHNAESMLNAWRDCFVGIEEPGALSDHEDETELRRLLQAANPDTQIPELGLGTRATNALDRANVLTVEDLLTVPVRRLLRLRGVGNKTRREIVAAVRILRERLGIPVSSSVTGPSSQTNDNAPVENDQLLEEVGNLSVDQLIGRISRTGGREGDTAQQTRQCLLGLAGVSQSAASDQLPPLNAERHIHWPSQTDVAANVGVTREQVGQLICKFQERWVKDPSLTGLRISICEMLAAAGGVMTIGELAESILVARGSVEDEPRRTILATAVARASFEVERTMAEPRFLVCRDDGRLLVALSQELTAYAAKLGDEADKLAMEDPLVPPARVLQRLRDVSLPAGHAPLSDARITRLAAASSAIAAVSSRHELYPRGMEAARAVKLSQGAIYGVPMLTVQQIRERIAGRYPEAAALPDRPTLDELLQAAGFDFEWHVDVQGAGRYVSRQRDMVSVTSGSESASRLATAAGQRSAGEITPEIADARQFEERLERGLKDGAFLAILVTPKNYQRAAKELCERFPVELVDLEALFIKSLQQVVQKAGGKWEAVVNADAVVGSPQWNKFMVLVNRAMPAIEQQLHSSQRTILLTYPGLLARYDHMALLASLRDQVGRKDGIPGIWLLIPGDTQPLLDGKAIPIISPGQRTRIPETWIRNEHRGITRIPESMIQCSSDSKSDNA